MLQALNSGRIAQTIAPIKRAMNMMNPQTALMQNPNYQRAMQLVQQNGGDAQKAFYALANQYGLDPAEILNALK